MVVAGVVMGMVPNSAYLLALIEVVPLVAYSRAWRRGARVDSLDRFRRISCGARTLGSPVRLPRASTSM